MYFRKLKLINVGPIEKIDYSFPFDSEGSPKPVILVGTNGAGKSILLSHLLNPLMLAQQVAFEDPELESDLNYALYKLCSPQYIRSDTSFSFARVEFGSDFSCIEWQLMLTKEDFLKQFGDPDIDDSFAQIPENQTSIVKPSFINQQFTIEAEFKENCVLYFPPNRFEQPAWLNKHNLKATAEFKDRSKLQGMSNRKIIQESPLQFSKNWLLDIALDQAINIWNEINNIIKLVLGTDEPVRFGIGSRRRRNVSILRNEVQWTPNIFQLSTGQTSILNIALSILRDFDMSGAKFETLADVKGVVIIDEVDAHLHADLQCNLLPALLKMFPKVQFILTTHSPLFLLGMKAKFGEEGFDVLELPSGNIISIEEFKEFQSAFEYYQDSSTFKRKIEAELEKSKKPVIFVEGDYDIKYLKKAASLLGEEDLLNSIELYDGEGFNNLDKIWKSFDNKLSSVLQKIVGLIYDCDTKKSNQDRNMLKKRMIPSLSSHPISKGIENLFPQKTIDNLRSSHPKFFDITPKYTKIVRGQKEVQPEICEFNTSEKKNLCDHLCKEGSIEDFEHFQLVFDIIRDIIGIKDEE
ncbi:MAG: AAA family ATPase [Symploca sp. SIO1B1]|nr:AAA family ATPase [Symploca sp. SIO1B1]